MTEWPTPFNGVTKSVTMQDGYAIAELMSFLADGCGEGHAHNIAVAFDGYRVYGSESFAACAQRWSENWESDL